MLLCMCEYTYVGMWVQVCSQKYATFDIRMSNVKFDIKEDNNCTYYQYILSGAIYVYGYRCKPVCVFIYLQSRQWLIQLCLEMKIID